MLLPEVAENAARLERFKREIHISSTVKHRNVLRVFDLGEGPGLKFLTMEYVEGENLAELIKCEGRLPVDRIVRILRQICQGLGAAHERGVLHRDLKPANVMIDKDDRALLTDFGIEESLEQTGMTQAGEIMGTPHYMSPEQVKGEPVDARSDIYSRGVMLYEMATGQVPYSDHTIYEVMIQRVQKNPRPAVELNPDLPPFLQHAIQRCMAIQQGGSIRVDGRIAGGTGTVSADRPGACHAQTFTPTQAGGFQISSGKNSRPGPGRRCSALLRSLVALERSGRIPGRRCRTGRPCSGLSPDRGLPESNRGSDVRRHRGGDSRSLCRPD